MRILCAAHHAGRIGGVETYLSLIVPALHAAGHDVACWFQCGDQAREPVIGAGLPVTSWIDSPESFEALRRWAPDVIYAHGFPDLAAEGRLLTIAPGVLFVHSYLGTCISGAKSHRLPRDRVCRRRFGPACLALFYPRRCGGWNPMTAARLFAVQSDRLSLMRGYNQLVVASRHMSGELARQGLAATTSVLPYPVGDPEPAPPLDVPASPTWRLLYVGRLERTKGADLALDCAAAASDALDRPVHLTVAGTGPLEASLRARVHTLAGRYRRLTVRMAGWLDVAARSAAYRNADLLLVPSRWPEPFGLVGLEAGAHRVPSVGFAVGGIPEWLADGVNGRLVPADPPDAHRFTRAIVDCLSNADRLERMREQSRAVAASYSMARHLQRLERILGSVARRDPAAAPPSCCAS